MTESINIVSEQEQKSVSDIQGIKNPLLIRILDTAIGLKLCGFDNVERTAAATDYSGDLALRWQRSSSPDVVTSLYFDSGVLTLDSVHHQGEERQHYLHVEVFPMNENTPDDGEMQYTSSTPFHPELHVYKPRDVASDKEQFERLIKMFYSLASGYRPDQD